MLVWPETLPKPLMAGFSEMLPDNALRTQMETGPDKVRVRTTSNVGTLTVPYLLTLEEVNQLVAFFKGDAAYGARAFDYEHPRTGGIISCRFAGPFEISSSDGKNYPITVQLVILP